MSAPPDPNAPAPSLPIPARAITAVEHPCIIRNVDKGIVSLGGPIKLSKALRSKPEPDDEDRELQIPDIKLPQYISASLRPDDPMAKRLVSTPAITNNVLLKVSVPARTGRKRKRGSSGPWVADEELSDPTPNVPGSTIFRSIKDNASKYTVTPVGIIDEAHRFRTLPDIQYAASLDKTMVDIRDNILPLKYSLLKKFKFDTAAGADLTRTIPPSPEFIQTPVQYGYKWQQNFFVKYTGDDREEINIAKRNSFDGYYFVRVDAPSVPTRPKPHLPPEHSLSRHVLDLIGEIRRELAVRPIITRQILYNTLGWDRRDPIREAAVYCGYFFETGPWREALIVFGTDPRKDPKYRHYQTISFNSFAKSHLPPSVQFGSNKIRQGTGVSVDDLRNEHGFDGVNFPRTGSLFQFCDISDPFIRRILDTDNIRETCATTYQGWYHVGTWAKATVVLKDKMNRIIRGDIRGGEADNAIYERIITWPEHWNDREIYDMYRHETQNHEVHQEKAQEFEVMQNVRAAARSARYAFEKMEEQEQKKLRLVMTREQHENAMDVDAEGEDDVEFMVPEDLTEVQDGPGALLDEADSDSDADDDDDVAADDDEEGLDVDDEDIDGEFERISDVEIDEPVITEAAVPGKPLPFGGLFK